MIIIHGFPHLRGTNSASASDVTFAPRVPFGHMNPCLYQAQVLGIRHLPPIVFCGLGAHLIHAGSADDVGQCPYLGSLTSVTTRHFSADKVTVDSFHSFLLIEQRPAGPDNVKPTCALYRKCYFRYWTCQGEMQVRSTPSYPALSLIALLSVMRAHRVCPINA